MQECTFRPAISSKSDSYARRARGCSTEPLTERLYHEADKRAAFREKAKELLEADKVGSHTFCPSVNHTQPTRSVNHVPIHKRVDVIQKRKQEKVRAAQLEEERKDLEGGFQPHISKRSRQIAQQKFQRSWSDGQLNRDFPCPVEERLYRDAQLKEQRREAQVDNLSQASIGPSVDDGSRRICKSSVYFQGAQQDFLTRQQTFEAARQRRREIRSQHAETECSFAPDILPSSRQLVSTKLDFLRSSPSDITERLAVKDVGRRDQRRREDIEAQTKDCTFRPTVSPASEQIMATSSSSSPGTPAHERLYRAAVDNMSRNSPEKEAEQYSFHPQVSPESAKKFAHVKSRYGSGSDVMRNVQDELERRSESLAEKRREVEQKEMAECTFAPGVAGAPFEDHCVPVPVSGLDRFFELRDLAHQQRERQRIREQRAFGLDLSDARCLGFTIPAPFELSGHAQVGDARGASYLAA